MNSQLTEIALLMLGAIERMEVIIPEITDTIRKALEEKAALAEQPVSEPYKLELPDADEVAELVQWLWAMRHLAGERNPEEQRRYARASDLLERLAPQPVPEGPTDQDIEALHQAVFASRLYGSPPSTTFEVDFARAVLARFGPAYSRLNAARA